MLRVQESMLGQLNIFEGPARCNSGKGQIPRNSAWPSFPAEEIIGLAAQITFGRRQIVRIDDELVGLQDAL